MQTIFCVVNIFFMNIYVTVKLLVIRFSSLYSKLTCVCLCCEDSKFFFTNKRSKCQNYLSHGQLFIVLPQEWMMYGRANHWTSSSCCDAMAFGPRWVLYFPSKTQVKHSKIYCDMLAFTAEFFYRTTLKNLHFLVEWIFKGHVEQFHRQCH